MTIESPFTEGKGVRGPVEVYINNRRVPQYAYWIDYEAGRLHWTRIGFLVARIMAKLPPKEVS